MWALGIVSLFMDISSEIVHSLLPLFLTTTLGVSVVVVGVIDGVSEATASITKLFSGYFSDRWGRRKPLLLLGYGLGVLSKPLFAIASSGAVVLGARVIDRLGKGIRGAPRDALIADVTPPEIRGRAFGLRQSLDTIGAFGGPLVAIGLMTLLADDMRTIFWIAVIPGLIAVACLFAGVDEAADTKSRTKARAPFRVADVQSLPVHYWQVVGTGVVFTLSRFSEAFLILKAHEQGLPLAFAPLVLVAMNLIYAVGAYPAGYLADRISAKTLLMAGLVCLVAADLTLGLIDGLCAAFFGICLWGAHMALTQGLFSKLIADATPDHLRGSAFGIFSLFTGIAMLLSSALAGLIWDRAGSDATFLAGAGVAIAAMAIASFTRTSNKTSGER